MSTASDLMTMMFLIKLVFLVVLALGTYFLCVEYGAQRWAAAALAVALPFGGFTLFWDAGSWASGLIAFAYTPWVWFVLRKVLRGTANPFWGFVLEPSRSRRATRTASSPWSWSGWRWWSRGSSTTTCPASSSSSVRAPALRSSCPWSTCRCSAPAASPCERSAG